MEAKHQKSLLLRRLRNVAVGEGCIIHVQDFFFPAKVRVIAQLCEMSHSGLLFSEDGGIPNVREDAILTISRRPFPV